MNLGILLIGDELLDGSVKDINASFLGTEIQDTNIKVSQVITVGDEIEHIKEAYKYIKTKCDVVIISGGLGPTPDDKTRFALSEFYNFIPIFEEENWEIVQNFFKNRGVKTLDSNKVQSYKPKEFNWVKNIQGTASGLSYFDGEVIFYSLPGVPFEFSEMFQNIVLPDIKNRFDVKISKKYKILFAGIGEGTIFNAIKDYPESKKISYLPNAENGVLIKYSDNEKIIKDILGNKLSEYIVSFDGSSLEFNIIKELKINNLTLSLAESCTGGSICGKLTSIPGASEVIKGGINSYMTKIKIENLGVDKSIIDNFGVVSKECSESMAINIRDKFKSDIALSITGFLGPTGGDKFANLGTVIIGISTENETFSVSYKFGLKDRIINKQIAIQRALHNLLKVLKKRTL